MYSWVMCECCMYTVCMCVYEVYVLYVVYTHGVHGVSVCVCAVSCVVLRGVLWCKHIKYMMYGGI